MEKPLVSHKDIEDRFIYGDLILTKDEAWRKGALFVRDIYEEDRRKLLSRIEELEREERDRKSNSIGAVISRTKKALSEILPAMEELQKALNERIERQNHIK